MRFAVTAVLMGLTAPAMAQDLAQCDTSMRGEAVRFAYDADNAALKDSLTLRQKIAGGEACPGLVVLRAFTPELTDADRAPFCLQWDRKAETWLGYDLGPRDGSFVCKTAKKQFCQRVNASRQTAARWGGFAADLALDAGTETLLHGAGIVSVKGPAALIGEKLLGLGATTVQSVGAGAAIGAVAVTAVAVGGAVYVCSDEGAKATALELAPGPKLRPGEVAPGANLPEGEARIIATPLPGPVPGPVADPVAGSATTTPEAPPQPGPAPQPLPAP